MRPAGVAGHGWSAVKCVAIRGLIELLLARVTSASKTCMGIENKHAYRFGYLKSDKWKTVRSEALVRDECRCQICGYQSFFNDAHHVHYSPSFWSTESEDIVTLCRPCHGLIHCLIPNFTNNGKQSRKKFDNVVMSLQDWFTKHEALAVRKEIIKPDCRFCKASMQSVELRNVHGVESNDRINAEWPICQPCWDQLNLYFPAPRSWTQIRAYKDKKHLLTNVA